MVLRTLSVSEHPPFTYDTKLAEESFVYNFEPGVTPLRFSLPEILH